MTLRGRLAGFGVAVVAAIVLAVVLAATDARDAGEVGKLVTMGQPSTSADAGDGDAGGDGTGETEVAGKVVERPVAKDVPALPDIGTMPRTGVDSLVVRLAVGLMLLGVGLVLVDYVAGSSGRRGSRTER